MSEEQSVKAKTLRAWQWIDFITFGLTLAFAIRNSVKYLVIQGRWTNFYVSAFYLFTLLTTSFRMWDLYLEFRLLEADQQFGDIWDKKATYANTLAFAFKSLLGIF